MITGISVRVVFTPSGNRFAVNRDHPIPYRGRPGSHVRPLPGDDGEKPTEVLVHEYRAGS